MLVRDLSHIFISSRLFCLEFPFDDQNCTLEFGAWTYDESKINPIALGDAAQLDAYVENNEWNLLSNSFSYTVS